MNTEADVTEELDPERRREQPSTGGTPAGGGHDGGGKITTQQTRVVEDAPSHPAPRRSALW